MGWDTCPSDKTKKDVVARLLREHGQEKIVAHKSTASGLWMVYRCNDGVLRIFFDLIERHGKEFSSKSMSASMGPFYADCPLEFLDLAPEEGETWLKWAGEVKEFHARRLVERTVVFAAGDRVTVVGNDNVVYEVGGSLNKNTVLLTRVTDGARFKCATKRLRHIEDKKDPLFNVFVAAH